MVRDIIDVVFATHTDSDQVRVAVDRRAEDITAIGNDSIALIGVNWSVNCGDDLDTCNVLKATLGGTVEVATP